MTGFEICRCLPWAGSGRIRRVDTPRDFLAKFALGNCDVILALEIKPGLRPIPKVACKAKRRVSRDGAASIENVGDAPRRNAKLDGEPVGAQLSCGYFTAKEAARMNSNCHTLPLVIVHNLDVIGVSVNLGSPYPRASAPFSAPGTTSPKAPPPQSSLPLRSPPPTPRRSRPRPRPRGIRPIRSRRR